MGNRVKSCRAKESQKRIVLSGPHERPSLPVPRNENELNPPTCPFRWLSNSPDGNCQMLSEWSWPLLVAKNAPSDRASRIKPFIVVSSTFDAGESPSS